MNFPKISRPQLKICARHAHFNFELVKDVAALIQVFVNLGIHFFYYWIPSLPCFFQNFSCWIQPKVVLLSFEDLQKIRIFPKFRRRSSKIVPAMPISILNLSRAWQPQFLCHTLEILVSVGSFIDKQMMFYKFFCIFNRKATISKKLIFLLYSSPQMVIF